MWHVLHTVPNRERQVSQLLEEHDVPVYLPRFHPGRRTRPGSVRAQQARCVFPGYLFFRLRSPNDSQKISHLPGVHRVLLEDGKPGGIAEDVIEHLQKRLHEGLSARPSRRFLAGQPVVIEHGPLAAVDAIFECDLDKRSRVQILVHLMGRSLKVQIDADHLRALAS